MNLCKRGALPIALWLGCLLPVWAGAPQLSETCRGPDNRPVPTRYDVKVRFFAEAQAKPPAILVNPEIFFIGRQTQQWLYLRQCVHLRLQHRIVQQGERALSLDEEELTDCLAAKELAASKEFGSNARTLMYSIESDIERALKQDRWRQLLPGPQRRIALSNCGR